MANERAVEARLGDGADVAELTNEYELRGELGRGGTAIVYRARDRALHREVAIKVVSRRAGQDDAVARLAREARTVAQLHHPNIVSVYAVRRLRSGGLALVMQYVPGTTLKDLVQAEGPLAPDRAERIMRDVAQALSYAHARGVVHRDVKPENIFLDADTGSALLADFGIARSAQQEQLTMTGTALGTPSYMSPEQVGGDPARRPLRPVQPRPRRLGDADRRRPWDGESLYTVIHKQKHEDLPPIEALRPGEVPLRIQYLVERMMQKRPAARWAGADGLLVQLSHAVLPSDFGRWQAALRPRVQRWREQERARERAADAGAAARASVNAATVQFRRNPDGLPEPPREATPEFARDVARARRARQSNEAETAAVTFDAEGNPVLVPLAAVPVEGDVGVHAPVGVSAPIDAGDALLTEESVHYDVAEPQWDDAPATDERRSGSRRRLLLTAGALAAVAAVGGAVFVWRGALWQTLGLGRSGAGVAASLGDSAPPPGRRRPGGRISHRHLVDRAHRRQPARVRDHRHRHPRRAGGRTRPGSSATVRSARAPSPRASPASGPSRSSRPAAPTRARRPSTASRSAGARTTTGSSVTARPPSRTPRRCRWKAACASRRCMRVGRTAAASRSPATSGAGGRTHTGSSATAATRPAGRRRCRCRCRRVHARPRSWWGASTAARLSRTGGRSAGGPTTRASSATAAARIVGRRARSRAW
jgi:tRNA A-37 threonylcarbamoyl transferase component Bud32